MRQTFREVWRKAVSHLNFYNRKEQDMVCGLLQEVHKESEPGLKFEEGRIFEGSQEKLQDR